MSIPERPVGYHDWAGAPLGLGDLILDDRGFPWRVKAFNYGGSNIALCEAVAFNHSREQAIRLGHVFKVKDVPRDARTGFLLYLAFIDFCNARGLRLKSPNWFATEVKKLGIKHSRYQWIGLGLPEKAEEMPEPTGLPQRVEQPEPTRDPEKPGPILPGDGVTHAVLGRRIKSLETRIEKLKNNIALVEHGRIFGDKDLEESVENRFNDRGKNIAARFSDLEQRMTQQEEALGMHSVRHDIRERSKGPSKFTRFHRAVRQRIRFVVTGR